MLEAVLKEAVNSRRGCHVKKKTDIYDVFDFVLRHGMKFDRVIPLPSDIKKGEPSQCHCNSFFTALHNKSELFYVEGFGKALNSEVSIPHAWITNKKLEAIDPTWIDNGNVEYYGIVLDINYVGDWSFKNGGSRLLITDVENGFPLMREDKKKWAVRF